MTDACWKQFLPKLEGCATMAEAQLLVAKAPPESDPCRRLYSNLGWFVATSTVPAGASARELSAYLAFHRRVGAAAFKPGAFTRIESDLERALEDSTD